MTASNSESGQSGSGARDRFWVSVLYDCCHIYQRVYFVKGRRTATGSCPRCLRQVRFELSDDGERGNFFLAQD